MKIEFAKLICKALERKHWSS